MRYVYLVYVRDISPHGFSSDWQDHREFKLERVFMNKKKADAYRARIRERGQYAVVINKMTVTED